ncbi:hypothetical protein [Streptomyces griseofuscus]|uniref:hypothetical protein n=1 Tax=Streptomyces griseofuscus TaxID=146922 RepID=UPI0036929D71
MLQQSLLPDSLPPVPGMRPTTSDFYDVFPIDGKRFAFFLGDVCGKGPRPPGSPH